MVDTESEGTRGLWTRRPPYYPPASSSLLSSSIIPRPEPFPGVLARISQLLVDDPRHGARGQDILYSRRPCHAIRPSPHLWGGHL